MAQHTATGASNYASGNFDVFRWYEGSTLVADYITCKSPDGVAGVWDDVNSAFLHSSGSAEFVAGPTDDPLAPHDGHNTNIGQVAREIEVGKVLLGGVAGEIKSGFALVSGVNREVGFPEDPVVITITGTGSKSSCYAKIGETKYAREATVEVEPGTEIILHANGADGSITGGNIGAIEINGTEVTTSNNEYSYTVEKNVKIELDYSNSSAYLYKNYIYVTEG